MLPDYRAMYYELVAKVSDAVELLVCAQQQGERQFVENTDRPEISFLHKGREEKENISSD